MSLITEALQLQKGAPRGRSSPRESFSPLRRSRPTLKVILGLAVFCAGGVLIFWKGSKALALIENMAGIHISPSVAAPLAPTTSMEVSAPSVPVTVPPEAPALVPPVPSEGGRKSETAALDVPKKTEVVSDSNSGPLSDELKPMDVNLSMSMIEDEKARQQLEEENRKKIDAFLRKLDVQGICHQGESSTALLDTVLVRVGDRVGDQGLILKKIESRRLIFSDRQAREYSKNY